VAHDPNMTVSDRLPDFDAFQIQSVLDPVPLYAEWRAAGPLVRCGPGQWGLTRHQDSASALKDRRLVHQMPPDYIRFAVGDGPVGDFRGNSLLNRDGAGHHRLRRLMSQAFTPGLVLELAPHLEAVVDDLLAPLLDGDDYDVVDRLAFPFPFTTICELLGLDPAGRDEIRGYAAALFGEDLPRAAAAIVWMRAYMADVLAHRPADPDGDLLSRMLAARDGEDRLTDSEIVDNALLLFAGGFETSQHLLATACDALAAEPGEWARLVADPALASVAVEEFLRLDPSVRRLSLRVLEPIEVGGRTIPEDRVVHVFPGCANRDPDVFTRPDRLDIGRTPNPHLSFGGGPHRCLGMHLARLEATIVVRRLAERLRTLEPAGAAERTVGTVCSYATLPLRGRAA
jgi:cytochrome P450